MPNMPPAQSSDLNPSARSHPNGSQISVFREGCNSNDVAKVSRYVNGDALYASEGRRDFTTGLSATSDGHADDARYLLNHGATMNRIILVHGCRVQFDHHYSDSLDRGRNINAGEPGSGHVLLQCVLAHGLFPLLPFLPSLLPPVWSTGFASDEESRMVCDDEAFVSLCLDYGPTVDIPPQLGFDNPLLDSAASIATISTFRTLQSLKSQGSGTGRGPHCAVARATACQTADHPAKMMMVKYVNDEQELDVDALDTPIPQGASVGHRSTIRSDDGQVQKKW